LIQEKVCQTLVMDLERVQPHFSHQPFPEMSFEGSHGDPALLGLIEIISGESAAQ
jgi:hypothetical protein